MNVPKETVPVASLELMLLVARILPKRCKELSLPKSLTDTLIFHLHSQLMELQSLEGSDLHGGLDESFLEEAGGSLSDPFHPDRTFSHIHVDAELVQRELSQYDSEFLDDFSVIAQIPEHQAGIVEAVVTAGQTITGNGKFVISDAVRKPMFAKNDLDIFSVRDTVVCNNGDFGGASSNPSLRPDTLSLSASDGVHAAVESSTTSLPQLYGMTKSTDLLLSNATEEHKEVNVINRFIDAQLCQRINTSIQNVNRIQRDFGYVTAVASCSECLVIGSSGGYLLVYDSNTGKVLSRFDRADALGPVTALDVNARGTRALCGYSRGHVALIDLQKSCRSGAGLLAGGSGEFLKTVSVASPLPTAILQARFCSSLTSNPNDDNHITCVCLESGGSVFRLRFRRLLSIITCDTDCIFSGARGEAFLIEPFVGPAQIGLMPEQHPLRTSQLLAVGTLNKVLLVSLTESTIDVFLNIPLWSGSHNTNSMVQNSATNNNGSRESRRPSSSNTILSSSSYADNVNNSGEMLLSARRHGSLDANRHLPCAAWAFASVQPAKPLEVFSSGAVSAAPASVYRDPVVAIACGLHLMLFHVYRDVRRMPVGRLIRNINFEQQQPHSTLMTSIVNVKWLSTVMLLLFDATGAVFLYDLKSNKVIDFIVPLNLLSDVACDTSSSSAADLVSRNTEPSVLLHSSEKNRSEKRAADTVLDERQGVVRRLFCNSDAYVGGELGCLVSEAMARAGERATYSSVSSSFVLAPALNATTAGQKKHAFNNQNDGGPVEAGNLHDAAISNNNSNQRLFCLYDNNTLSCLRLRTWKERLEELERHALYVDALEFVLKFYEAKVAGAVTVLLESRRFAPSSTDSTPLASSSSTERGVADGRLSHVRGDLHRLVMNIASQIAARNAVFIELAQNVLLSNIDNNVAVKTKILMQHRNIIARYNERAVKMCFAALSLLTDASLLADFYQLLSFDVAGAAAENSVAPENAENHRQHISIYETLCQSVSPEFEFFIYLPSLLRYKSRNRIAPDTKLRHCWYDAQLSEFMNRFLIIILTTISEKNDAVEMNNDVDKPAVMVNLRQQVHAQLLRTFQLLTLEVDINCFNDVEKVLTVARHLCQTHTIMRISMDRKNDFISPIREFLDAMRHYSKEAEETVYGTDVGRHRQNAVQIASHRDFEQVGNNVIFYVSENLKGRRCVDAATLHAADDDALISDIALRQRVQEETWHLLVDHQRGSYSAQSDKNTVRGQNLLFLLHFSAKDLLNALQMCYADRQFCETIAVEQRNWLVSMLIKIMLTGEADDDTGKIEGNGYDDKSEMGPSRSTCNETEPFTPAQVAHLFTFIARLIASSTSQTKNTDTSTTAGSAVVDVNRALLEQILHHLCQRNFSPSKRQTTAVTGSSSSDERESALIELYEAGALQCMDHALILDKAKKAQFLSFVKLIYTRSARYDELFGALLECIVQKRSRKRKPHTAEQSSIGNNIRFDAGNDDDAEIRDLFTVARRVILKVGGVVACSTAESKAAERVAITLLEHIVLLAQLDAEQTSFLVLQYFIKQRIAVETISSSAGHKKLVLVPQTAAKMAQSDDEILLSILRVFDTSEACNNNNSDTVACVNASSTTTHQAKYDFIMCFWKRGVLPLNYNKAMLEMAASSTDSNVSSYNNNFLSRWSASSTSLDRYDSDVTVLAPFDDDGDDARQASARVCLFLIDWTCRRLADLREKSSDEFVRNVVADDEAGDEPELTNTLVDILRTFYSTSTALSRLLANEEARRICRKYSVWLGEAYLFELDGEVAHAYDVLFRQQFCSAVDLFTSTATAFGEAGMDAVEDVRWHRHVQSNFSTLMAAFEPLLEFCQRVNNRVAATVAINENVDASTPTHVLTRQQMWLGIFEKFMTLMKHVECLQNRGRQVAENPHRQIIPDFFDAGIVERAGDALQRLLAAMIMYHVDMLHVLKQLIRSGTTNILSVNNNGKKPSRIDGNRNMATEPRIRLILDNIIASYEYQCTLYESVTTLLQSGVYNSLAHYVRSMRKHGLRVSSASLSLRPAAFIMPLLYYTDSNKWRPTRRTGGMVCCVCSQPIVLVDEYSCDEQSDSRNSSSVAVLHTGGCASNRLAHLTCMQSKQKRSKEPSSSDDEEVLDHSSSKSTAANNHEAQDHTEQFSVPSPVPFLTAKLMPNYPVKQQQRQEASSSVIFSSGVSSSNFIEDSGWIFNDQ